MNVSAISVGLLTQRASIAMQEAQRPRPAAKGTSSNQSAVKPVLPIDFSNSQAGGSLPPEPFPASVAVPVSMVPVQENKRVFLALGEALVRLIGVLSSSE